mmetsp:Transcript_28444/g.83123  ORF Transcript_28444/g.83123 Transcript_28444/m.83123 type:complete len:187 (+) Transcript_28444:8-568(+)
MRSVSPLWSLLLAVRALPGACGALAVARSSAPSDHRGTAGRGLSGVGAELPSPARRDRKSGKPASAVERVVVVGERNTGTNWLFKMLEVNLNITVTNHFCGWKHFFHDSTQCSPKEIHQIPSTLMVVLWKNPFDWILSMHRNPYHMQEALIHSDWRSHCALRVNDNLIALAPAPAGPHTHNPLPPP